MKYLMFKDISHKFPKKITKTFEVWNQETNYYLGVIEWSGRWRQYISVQRIDEQVQMAKGCHREVADFIEKLMEDRKEKKLLSKEASN